MATAKKPAKASATRARTTKATKATAKTKATPEASAFVTFLVMAFAGLSIVFAIVAYVYYAT